MKYIENSGAGDEIRTHDPHLGKVMLYHSATPALKICVENESEALIPW